VTMDTPTQLSTTSIRENLLVAAEVISTDGWAHGFLRENNGSYCINGALYVANGEEFEEMNVEGQKYYCDGNRTQEFYGPEREVLKDYITRHYRQLTTTELWEWNDSLPIDEGQDVVISVLRGAAAELQE